MGVNETAMSAETITVRRDLFEDLIRKKEEFDAVVESIELMSNPDVQKALKKSSRDIREGKVHSLRSVLPKKRK